MHYGSQITKNNKLSPVNYKIMGGSRGGGGRGLDHPLKITDGYRFPQR